MTRTLEVPCWPVVRIYMEHQYGSPVVLNFSDPECKIIGLMLQSSRNEHFLDHACRNTTYDDSFSLQINDRMRMQTGYKLSATRIMEINGIIKNKFYDWIFTRLDAELRVDPEFVIKQGILDLCHELDDQLLDEHVPYDTIQKAYCRYRKANELPIKQNWSRKPKKKLQKKSFNEAA